VLDVKNRILDGAMGVAGAQAAGIFAAACVAAIPSKGILALVDAGDVDGKIGDGPLRDLIMSTLSIAKTTVYAIALEGSVAVALSAVRPASANTGGGTVAVSGSPRNEYDVSVEIVSPGGLNDAVFRVTLDGAAGKAITVPDNGQYVIPNTGITLIFSAEGPAFASGDSFTFSSTPPQAANAEVLTAVDQILNANCPSKGSRSRVFQALPSGRPLPRKPKARKRSTSIFSLSSRRGISTLARHPISGQPPWKTKWS
jgi:hypothetical protein